MSGSAERHVTFPSAVEAFFLVAALFGLEHLLSAGFAYAGYWSRFDAQGLGTVIQLLGNGLLFSGLVVYKRLTYASIFHPAKHSVAATLGTLSLPILLVVPGLLLASGTVEALVEWLVPLSQAEQQMFERMMSPGLVTIVGVCILAPVLEEMLFRGIILRSFLQQYPAPVAIIASALLFGASHMNLYQFVGASLFGLFAGWLYERARSLWPCILLHASYNAMIAWLTFSSEDAAAVGVDHLSVAYWMTAAVAAFIGASMLRRILAPAATA